MANKVGFLAALTVLLLGGGLLLYLFFRYLAGVLFPFVLGWMIAMLSRSPAYWLHRKLKIAQGKARLLLVGVITAALGAIFFFAVRGLFHELSLVLGRFGEDGDLFLAKIKEWLLLIPVLGKWLAEGQFLEQGLTTLFAALPHIVATLAGILPSALLSLFVSVLAAVYFCLDLDRIHAALFRLLPQSFFAPIHNFKSSALRAALCVLRAQGILTLVAFVLLLLGFLLLDISYPLLLSAVFALLDFLPVLGVGLFLVPWGVFSLITGARGLGIGLLVLFGVIAVLRQILEVRLLGHGYGLHPLVTLLSLYAGARLLGVWGILLFPAVTLLLYECLLRGGREREKQETGR